jgi:hypothetical protein
MVHFARRCLLYVLVTDVVASPAAQAGLNRRYIHLGKRTGDYNYDELRSLMAACPFSSQDRAGQVELTATPLFNESEGRAMIELVWVSHTQPSSLGETVGSAANTPT